MVVDIFSSKGSHMPFSRMLPDVLEELGIFALHFVFLCGILFLVKRFRSRLLALSAAFLMPFFQLFFVWKVSIHSEVFLSVALAFLLTVQIRLLDLIPFHTEDLLFLFAAFLFPARLFNSTSVLLGHLWLFWLIFCTYHTAVRLSLHSLRGNQFFCYLSFVVLSVSAYGFFLAIHFAVPFFQKAFGNHALALVAVTGLYLLLGAGAVWLLRHRLGDAVERLNQLGKKYPAIESYYFLCSALILSFCTAMFLPFSIMSSQNMLVFLLFPALCLVFLAIQLLFFRLLFRVAFYKDYASFSQLEKEGLASYYQNLRGTLSAMQDIRHDIKNIFFTMGNFVNESENQEMKDFFWKRIYPYAQDTIRQSELLSSICQLPSEPLRAFFFLKVSQALQQKASISMMVQVLPEEWQAGMDPIDLTRILGILMDNAIEEALLVPGGMIEIRITGKPYGCCYPPDHAERSPYRRKYQRKREGKRPGHRPGTFRGLPQRRIEFLPAGRHLYPEPYIIMGPSFVLNIQKLS